MDPTPKSLILDLLATLRQGSAPVRALVTAGPLFGLGDNSMRVALARLLAEGLVERDERGRYRLGRATAVLNERIRSWARVEERLEPWSGGWIGVQNALARRRASRAEPRRARALRLLGFRALVPGLEIRPDNLRGGAEAAREQLAALGLETSALVFRLSGLDPETDARARTLWEAAELRQGYLATTRRLQASAARLRERPREAAMAESFCLGGDGIRQIVLDPLLPDPIGAAVERRALIEAMRRYDRLGREIWAGWLGGDAAESDAGPAGVRGIEAAPELIRA